jgi:hypothetical protein
MELPDHSAANPGDKAESGGNRRRGGGISRWLRGNFPYE